MAPRKVNTLILRVDYNYQYKSHPELRDTIALSSADVDRLVEVCKKNNIRIIPQIKLLDINPDLLKTSKLLEVYPQFDETLLSKCRKNINGPFLTVYIVRVTARCIPFGLPVTPMTLEIIPM